MGCDPLTASHTCLNANTDCACQFNLGDSPNKTSINVVDCSKYCEADSEHPVGICNDSYGCVCGAAPSPASPAPDGKLVISCGDYGSSKGALSLEFGGETTKITCGMANVGKVAFRASVENILDVADPLNAWLSTSTDAATSGIAPGQSQTITVTVNRGYFDTTRSYTGALRFTTWSLEGGADSLSTIDVPVTVSAPFVMRVGETIYEDAYGDRYVALLKRLGPTDTTVSVAFEGSGDMAFEVTYVSSSARAAPRTTCATRTGKTGHSYKTAEQLQIPRYLVDAGGDGDYGTVVIRQEGYATSPDDCDQLQRIGVEFLTSLAGEGSLA